MGARVLGYRLSRHPYEEYNWRFISKTLRAGDVFFDIGANQGFYTILAAKMVGPEGLVVAFEPAPGEAAKLRRNLRLNRLRNVMIEQRALGGFEGVTPFHLCLGHQGSFSSIAMPSEDVIVPRKIIEVPVTTLDAYVERSSVAFLAMVKLDVEGAELSVLQGASRVLQMLRPVISCEIEDRRTLQWGYRGREILDFVGSFHYVWFSLTSNVTLRRHVPQLEYSWQNLLAVPREKLRLFGSLIESE